MKNLMPTVSITMLRSSSGQECKIYNVYLMSDVEVMSDSQLASGRVQRSCGRGRRLSEGGRTVSGVLDLTLLVA